MWPLDSLQEPPNHEQETALHCAAQYGHSEVVALLLQELTDPTMRNSRHETPLDLASLYGRLQWEGPWRTRMRTMSTSPRQAARCSGKQPLIMWKALNVNCTDSSGYTPLHHASLNGHR
ncbi:hypothetical protein CRUP_002849 [Coryphaenoides rupestris]|nr:hypothetical protein CRUP_002849 [Coryphaenoides rupestris]